MTRPASWCALLSALLLLSGCGALFGGGKADLYRFGAGPVSEPAQPNPGAAAPLILAFAGSSFERASGGDRILTTSGNGTNYVAKARWVSPAEELFDAALIRQLQTLPQVQLVHLGQGPLPDYVIAVDVRRFEAVYSGGAESPPDVVADTWVTLMRRKDRVIVGQWPVIATEHAGENRVTYIVAAFDRATATVTARVAELAGESLHGV